MRNRFADPVTGFSVLAGCFCATDPITISNMQHVRTTICFIGILLTSAAWMIRPKKRLPSRWVPRREPVEQLFIYFSVAVLLPVIGGLAAVPAAFAAGLPFNSTRIPSSA